MASLFTKTKLYIEANSKTWDDTKVSLQNNSDGNGDFIASWSYDIAKPTEEQLDNLESQADAVEALNQIISNRKSEYPTIEECVHAILDDTLDELQILRQAVKEKYPK